MKWPIELAEWEEKFRVADTIRALKSGRYSSSDLEEFLVDPSKIVRQAAKEAFESLGKGAPNAYERPVH